MRKCQRTVLADGERSGGGEVETDGDGELQGDIPERRGLFGKGLRDGAGTGETQDSRVVGVSHRAKL